MLRLRSKAVCKHALLSWMLLASVSPTALAQTAAPPPVQIQPAAVPAPSPRAAEVQAALFNIAQQWANLAGASNPLTSSGDIQVSDLPDGRVQVTLPETTLADTGGRLVIPAIRYTETPATNGRRTVSVTLPDRISWIPADPKDSVVLTYGEQKIDLIWLDAAQTYEKADILIRDISLSTPNRPNVLRIDTFSLVQDLNERTPGSWSGLQTLGLKNLHIVDTRDSEMSQPDVHIGAIEATTEMVDFRLIDYTNRMKAAGLDPLAPPPSLATSENKLTQMRRVGELGRDIPTMIGAIASAIRVRDVAIQQHGPDRPTFALSGATIRWDAGGQGDGKLKMAVQFDVEKMVLDGDLKPTRNAEFIPQSIGLGLSLDNVPGAALWSMMLGNFDQALELQMAALREQNTVEPEPDDTGQPPADEDVEEETEDTDEETTDVEDEPAPVDEAFQSAFATSLVMSLPILAQHPPRLTLDRLDILGSLASAKATGAVQYDPNAQFMGVGALDVTLIGLDKSIELIGKSPAGSEERQSLPFLTALRGVAKAEAVENNIQHRLHIEIPAQGDVTVNGIALEALINPPKAKPQKKK